MALNQNSIKKQKCIGIPRLQAKSSSPKNFTNFIKYFFFLRQLQWQIGGK